jgi:light-regulated signal transduction histidine kinase (bacteriophytochrome)
MVASFTQLLAKRYQDKLDQDAQDFIKFAVDGATRMQALISDLLAYSRVDRQEKPLKLTNCDAILEQVLVNLKLAIFDSGAVITHDPLPRMMADAAQLGQLFQNLLGNAIKFRSEKPTRVHFSSQRDGNGWKISVQDNGIGISSEYRERVFLIFQRLHTTAEYPGTGIGLAICKKIVERHGGRIWIESPPEGGSIFSFTLLTPLVT